MFKIESLQKGLYTIYYLDKTIVFSIYRCKKRYSSIEEELENILDIHRDKTKTVALIPINTIKTDLQIIQGVFNFYVYREKFAKIRNKGLLLSMFILGMDQLKTTIECLEENYRGTNEYFLIILDHLKINRENCTPYNIRSRFRKDELLVLSKNINNILEKL